MRTDEIAAIQAAYREIDVVTARWRALSATCDHLTPEGSANLDSLGTCRACYLKCGALGIDPVARAAQKPIMPHALELPEQVELTFPGCLYMLATRASLTVHVKHSGVAPVAVRISEAMFVEIARCTEGGGSAALRAFVTLARWEDVHRLLSAVESVSMSRGMDRVRGELRAQVHGIAEALGFWR